MLHLKKIVGSEKLSNRKIIAKRKKKKMAKQYAVYHTEKGKFLRVESETISIEKRGRNGHINTQTPNVFISMKT